MKSFKKVFPTLALIVVTIGLFFAPIQSYEVEEIGGGGDFYEAVVVEILDEYEADTFGGFQLSQELEATITSGELKGESVVVVNEALSVSNSYYFEVGDKLVVMAPETLEGDVTFYAVEPVRRHTLFWLFILFVGVVVLVARWQGVHSILGMLFSFLVLFKFILPQLLNGADPVVTVILGSVLIIPVTFYLSHGINRKTNVAIVGTLLTLILTGILSSVAVDLAHLTGLSSEESAFLKIITGDTIDFHGLLLAGILISLLGILDDVTVSQASVVHELRQAKKKISSWELYTRALNVGKDHIASMVNTLVLVYTGAALPLLMLFLLGSDSLNQILNYEFVAEEILQTLVASIGLILAVPVTTLLACIAKPSK